MGQNSSIEWTDHTFNPWWGCTKVSPGCQNCYAELWAKRTGHQVWGKDKQRRFFNDRHWDQPVIWNEEAAKTKTRRRVFCASMADLFERNRSLNIWRERLWSLIEATPLLDWLLLTKRPENVEQMMPWKREWPENVWLGTTVENAEYAAMRLPLLLKYPAAIRFLSCEPLLGPIDLRPWACARNVYRIDWVIAGGESGPGARPMHPDWASSLLHQCQELNVPFQFKQWGHWVPAELSSDNEPRTLIFKNERPVNMVRLAKKAAGRILEGATWDGLPTPSLGNAKR
jgi:protein gp37